MSGKEQGVFHDLFMRNRNLCRLARGLLFLFAAYTEGVVKTLVLCLPSKDPARLNDTRRWPNS